MTEQERKIIALEKEIADLKRQLEERQIENEKFKRDVLEGIRLAGLEMAKMVEEMTNNLQSRITTAISPKLDEIVDAVDFRIKEQVRHHMNAMQIRFKIDS